ncbi:hypothetical protein GP486_006345, partial [Trichoglossum hirsutum]
MAIADSILHPFLDKERIAGLVSAFTAKVNSTKSGTAASAAGIPFAVSRMQNLPVNTPKRKRPTTTLMGSSNTTSRTLLERSISTVLGLLVLALGKICDHRTWVPGPAQDNRKSPMMSPPLTPVQHSPTSSASSTYTTLPPPLGSPRIPNERQAWSENVEPRNVDVTPGLAYYALATEILGPLMGGNDLPHVQAGLLAGLYCGQLGRVLESWKWINWACVSCQVLLRKSMINNEQNLTRKEPIICAFWTCLQLESDVLAELDLPSNKDSKHAGWSKESTTELNWQLGRWRDVLPQRLRWKDDDPPPSDINAARLRAKYYGAKCLIHRPFVHHALHPLVPQGTHPVLPEEAFAQLTGRLSNQSSPTNLAALPENAAFEPTGRRKSGMAMAPLEPVAGVVDKSVIDACKSCIDAAIQSTKAFHGVRGRPIVTNIFGTAHA